MENDSRQMWKDFYRIDLNEINVERQGSGVDIQFDPAMI